MFRAKSSPDIDVEASRKRLHSRKNSRSPPNFPSRRVSVRTDFEVVDDAGSDSFSTKKWTYVRNRRARTPDVRLSRSEARDVAQKAHYSISTAGSPASTASFKSEPEPRSTKAAQLRQRAASEHKQKIESPPKKIYHFSKRPSQPKVSRSPDEEEEEIRTGTPSSAGSQRQRTKKENVSPTSSATWARGIFDKNALKLDFRGLNDDEEYENQIAKESISNNTGTKISNFAKTPESQVEKMQSPKEAANLHHPQQPNLHMRDETMAPAKRKNANYDPVQTEDILQNMEDGTEKEDEVKLQKPAPGQKGLNDEKVPTPPSSMNSAKSTKKVASYRRASLQKMHGDHEQKVPGSENLPQRPPSQPPKMSSKPPTPSGAKESAVEPETVLPNASHAVSPNGENVKIDSPKNVAFHTHAQEPSMHGKNTEQASEKEEIAAGPRAGENGAKETTDHAVPRERLVSSAVEDRQERREITNNADNVKFGSGNEMLPSDQQVDIDENVLNSAKNDKPQSAFRSPSAVHLHHSHKNNLSNRSKNAHERSVEKAKDEDALKDFEIGHTKLENNQQNGRHEIPHRKSHSEKGVQSQKGTHRSKAETARNYLGKEPVLGEEKIDTIRKFLEDQASVDNQNALDVHDAFGQQTSTENANLDPVQKLTLVIEKITEEKRQITELCAQLLQQMQLASSKLIEIEAKQEQSLRSFLPKETKASQFPEGFEQVHEDKFSAGTSVKKDSTEKVNSTEKDFEKQVTELTEKCKGLEAQHEEKTRAMTEEHKLALEKMSAENNARTCELEDQISKLQAKLQPAPMSDSSAQTESTEENLNAPEMEKMKIHIPPEEVSNNTVWNENMLNGQVDHAITNDQLKTVQAKNGAHDLSARLSAKFSTRLENLQNENERLKVQLEELNRRCDMLTKIIMPSEIKQ